MRGPELSTCVRCKRVALPIVFGCSGGRAFGRAKSYQHHASLYHIRQRCPPRSIRKKSTTSISIANLSHKRSSNPSLNRSHRIQRGHDLQQLLPPRCYRRCQNGPKNTSFMNLGFTPSHHSQIINPRTFPTSTPRGKERKKVTTRSNSSPRSSLWKKRRRNGLQNTLS